MHSKSTTPQQELPASAHRVQQYLTDRGYTFTVLELAASTRTAIEAAASVGCSVAQIAKSLIFRDENSDQPVLVIASGANRVDTKKITAASGLRLGRADGRYVKERVGFAIGGVPPVAHTVAMATFLDRDLQQFATIWAAAGTPHALFELPTAELPSLTGGSWLDLAAVQE